MSGRGLDLVDFSLASNGVGSVDIAPVDEPDDRSEKPDRNATYEDGYRSGWDDAVKAAEEKDSAISAELERNLRDLGFSYFEAREEIMQAVRPFLDHLLETLFPELLSEIAASAIAESLVEQAKKGCDGEIALLVAPGDSEIVKRLLPETDALSISVREEPTLTSGQVHIRPASHEIIVDAERVIAQLREAVSASRPTGEAKHG